MSRSSLPCPACGKNLTTKLGKLKPTEGVIRLRDPGYLYHCVTCGLLFRHPYPSPARLAEAYSKLPSDQWVYPEDRPDFALAVNVIRNTYPSGSILDVGCFRGDFLTMLQGNYQKYGIEIADSACEIARQRGITLIGSSIDQVEVNRPMFHVITLLDVVEHLPYARTSLERMTDLLLPGGIVILSTGNSDSLPWRLMRCDYWYYFPEHVSFFNPRWFHWVANKLNLDVVLIKKFSHYRGPVIERWRQLARCFVFWTAKHVDQYLSVHRVIQSLYSSSKLSRWSSPPKTHLWRDHMLVVLRSAS